MSETGLEAPIDQRVEIRHSETHDIILNLTADNQAAVHFLADQFWSGLPSSWPAYMSYPGVPEKYHVDRSSNPNFFAKQIVSSDPESIKKNLWKDSLTGTARRRKYNAAMSLLSEITKSPKIKSILGSDEAKQIATKHGFDRIEFIEPLIGVIDRSTGGKQMVYPFVRFVDFHREYGESPTPALRHLFEKNGIYPEDLSTPQLKIGTGEEGIILHILDAEYYFKQKTSLLQADSVEVR